MSKRPPSPSGVALYAAVFGRALSDDANVRSVAGPPDPSTSQQLRQVVGGFVRGMRVRNTDIVQVELSGRALLEFYFVQALLLRRRRPWLSVTCHDLPSLVGPALLVRLLDRRRLRRVGLRLSASVGAALERRLLLHVDSLFALTETGAHELSERCARSVHALPHVIDEPGLVHKSRQVFVPGYVDSTDSLIDLARVVYAEQGWTLVVGSCPRSTAARVQAELGPARSVVRFLGHVDEATLLRTFSESAVAVRVAGGHPSNSNAASGPLAWALARSCICLTNDRRAGATELAAAGFITQTDELDRELSRVLRVAAPGIPLLSPDLVVRVRARFGAQQVARTYWAALDSDVREQLESGRSAP